MTPMKRKGEEEARINDQENMNDNRSIVSFRRSFNTYYIWRTTPSFHRHRSRQKSKMGDRAAPRRDSFSTLLVVFFSF
jgi:hypothetical protein